jgi:hypothetical protein
LEAQGPVFFTVQRRPTNETVIESSRAFFNRDGTFEISRLTPGEYWVIASVPAVQDVNNPAVRTELEATAAVTIIDSDVADMVLRLEPVAARRQP